MPRTIVTYPNPVLAKKAAPVAEITDEIRALAAEMIELMYKDKGIGLAAPQVAESIRLITVDLSGPDKREDPRVFVNPVLSNLEGEVESEEGCLSVRGYRTTVARAETLHLSAQDLDGNPLELEAEGFLARIFQHECDHLDGTVFPDRLDVFTREAVLKEWVDKREAAIQAVKAAERPDAD